MSKLVCNKFQVLIITRDALHLLAATLHVGFSKLSGQRNHKDLKNLRRLFDWSLNAVDSIEADSIELASWKLHTWREYVMSGKEWEESRDYEETGKERREECKNADGGREEKSSSV